MARFDRRRLCGSAEHAVSRRSLLGGAAVGAAAFAADMTGLDVLSEPTLAAELKRQQKHVILLWLAGGASQLETWDPKPGTRTGGPFAAIPTDVPGLHISELMPKMAQRMKTSCVIRSLNTKNGDHGGGSILMMRGRMDEPGIRYPDLGAILARELGRADSQVPDYVSFFAQTEGRGFSQIGPGFLGARYAPIQLTDKLSLPNIQRLESISELDHHDRAALQALFNQRFVASHNTSGPASHATSYARVQGLMSSTKLFDLTDEPQSQRDKYGPTQFGEQALIARRLVEAGVPFVRLARAWWDSHGQNFETHTELCADLDHVMSTLLDDLKDRGLLENTLVVTLAEFGRTPNINQSLGRDHFASAWSSTLSGCGVKSGAVYGKSDEEGHRVADGEIGAGQLFATIFQALGIDHRKNYHIGARPIPLVNPGFEPVREVLA